MRGAEVGAPVGGDHPALKNALRPSDQRAAMTSPSGFTLPVLVAAAARAPCRPCGLAGSARRRWIQLTAGIARSSRDLRPCAVEAPPAWEGTALGIKAVPTRRGLDLTRDLPILVFGRSRLGLPRSAPPQAQASVAAGAGEGVGHAGSIDGGWPRRQFRSFACLQHYARQLP